MNIGSIQIQSVPARLGLTITPQKQELETTQPKMELTITRPKMELKQSQPHLSIDQYPSRASAGMKSNADLMEEYAQAGQQLVMEGIARRSSEGDQLRSIESKQNPIPAMADSAMGALDIPEVDIGWAPSVPPAIRVEASPSPVQAETSPGEVHGDLKRGQVDNRMQWGKVDIYLQQKDSLTITPPALDARA